MTRRPLLILVALAAVLAGCGDDDTADDPNPAQETTTTTGAPATDATEPAEGEAAAATVTIAGFDFEPGSIEVPAGTTVTWQNDDDAGHTVTAGTPDAPADTFAESVDGGSQATVEFAEAGTFPYFCTIHPSMTGEVVVS